MTVVSSTVVRNDVYQPRQTISYGRSLRTSLEGWPIGPKFGFTDFYRGILGKGFRQEIYCFRNLGRVAPSILNLSSP